MNPAVGAMNPGWIVAGAAATSLILVQGVLFFRWIFRRVRDDQINRAFVRDMAMNHLPHIYHALKRIAQENGVELSDPPPVRWIDLTNGAKRG